MGSVGFAINVRACASRRQAAQGTLNGSRAAASLRPQPQRPAAGLRTAGSSSEALPHT